MQDGKILGGGFPLSSGYADRDRPLASSPIIPNEVQEDLFSSLMDEHIGNDFIDSIQGDGTFHDDPIDTKYPIIARPFERSGPPARGCYSGPFNFNVVVSNTGADRRQFAYSPELNRVYLPMLAELPIEFKWDWTNCLPNKFWVRATIILAGTEQQESRVVRCHNHRVGNDASNRDVLPHIHPHILRSARTTEDIVYCGNEHNEQHWLSVAFSMNEGRRSESETFTHVYRFCCKHSCTSGINRRRIEVLFTLEDSMGEIYGRKSIGVRVCSCPKRDMEKDLNEFHTKRSGSHPQKRQMIVKSRIGPTYVTPNGVRMSDRTSFTLNLEIFGRSNYELLLTTAYNAMAAELIRLPNESNERLKYIKSMEEIQGLRRNLNIAGDSS